MLHLADELRQAETQAPAEPGGSDVSPSADEVQRTCALSPDGVPVAPAVVDSLVGRTVGRKFVLEKQLGAGGMGAVYRARHTALEKVVAIKVMHGAMARDATFLARFHREAKAASRLDHPSSIRVLDYGQDDDGLLYIAMEYLDGRDLAHVMKDEWPLSSARIIDLLSQALAALAVAHDLGITHRDLKPENIMVVQGLTDDAVDVEQVKVCDFGIAKLMESEDDVAASLRSPGDAKLTTAGLVIGTPAYMSPEQGRGGAVDGRSDIYSMGVILYELLTGQLPFDAALPMEVVVMHQMVTPVPPSTLRGGIDPELEAVCLKALEKAPENRYATARDLRTALRSGRESPVSPAPEARPSAGTLVGLGTGANAAYMETCELLPAQQSGPTTLVASEAGKRPPSEPPPGRSGWPVLASVMVVAMIAGRLGWQQGRPSPPSAPVVAGEVNEVPRIAAPIESRVVPSWWEETPSSSETAAPVSTPIHRPSPPSVAQAAVRAPIAKRRATSPPTGLPAASTDRITVQVARGGEPAPLEPRPLAGVPPPAIVPLPLPLPAPSSAPVNPPPPRFDVASASVEVRAPVHLDHTGATGVTAAVGRAASAFTECYRRALLTADVTLEGALGGAGMLHVETDDDGWITRARLTGGARGSVPACIETVVQGRRISGVDTGAASADVPLVFKPR